MKRLCYLIGICLLLTGVVKAEDPTGIKFFTGSWKAVLAEAKRQNKLVFVDIYTTWCGPCKQMAKQAFPDPTVGETFNTHFINYQIDAEKGEGIALANTYTITAYPTSLYVNGNGDLIQRTVGYSGIPGMLAEAQKAIAAANDPNPLSALEKQYAEGNRAPNFLALYLAKRGQTGTPNGKALDEYLTLIPESEWSSDNNLGLIASNMTGDNAKVFNLLMQKIKEIRPLTDKPSVALANQISEKLGQLINIRFDQATATKDERLLEAVINDHETYQRVSRRTKLDEKELAEMANDFRMGFYQETKNISKYRALASAEGNRLIAIPIDSIRARDAMTYKQFQTEMVATPDSVKNRDDFKAYVESLKTGQTREIGGMLNSLARSCYELMTDKQDLTQALVWSAKSLDYDRSAIGLDTYAHLLSKLGRKAEAIKTQEEAIKKAKAAGDDTTKYEKELARVKKQ